MFSYRVTVFIVLIRIHNCTNRDIKIDKLLKYSKDGNLLDADIYISE